MPHNQNLHTKQYVTMASNIKEYLPWLLAFPLWRAA